MAALRKLISLDFEVFGKVQGVWFRKYTQEQATKLSLVGWCMNTEKGTVCGVMQGMEEKINEMKDWLQHTGSPMSSIDHAEFRNQRSIEKAEFEEFSIRCFPPSNNLMYSESFTVSEFASRLSKISLSSFNDILYLVQEYESICELRGNEIDSFSVDSTQISKQQEYEFVKGEEYLWALIKELVTLFIAESKLPASTVMSKNEDESLQSDFQFLYWSAIQNWLQKLRKKTTKITSYEENTKATDLSFHSLFQTYGETTSNQEAELLKTMFDAFRCGAFDDDCEESQEDWNKIFDGYSNIWRQCSLNGASATESIRDSFHELCRSFKSDNVYECILYSIHTAESITDLQQIEAKFIELYEDLYESYNSFDLLMDVVWSCVTCLLYQLSLQAHHQHHGNITQLENYTREKIQSLCSYSSISCQYLGFILNQSFSSILTQSFSSSSCLDDYRLHTHLILILHSIYTQIIHTPFSIHSSQMNYPAPFSSLKQSISYSDVLLTYLHLLGDHLDIQSICCYFKVLNETQKMDLSIQYLHQLFLTCLESPYQTILQQLLPSNLNEFHDHYILGKVFCLLQTIQNQSSSFCQQFFYRISQIFIQVEKSSSQAILYISRFICCILYGMNENEYTYYIIGSLVCIWNQAIHSYPDTILTIIQEIMEEKVIQDHIETISEENQTVVEMISQFSMNVSKSTIMNLLSFYSKIFHYIKQLEEICNWKDNEKQRLALQNSFNRIQELLCFVQDNTQCFLSILVFAWIHCVEKCMESMTIDENEKVLMNQLIITNITQLTSPSNQYQQFIQPSFANELVKVMKKSMINVLYKPC